MTTKKVRRRAPAVDRWSETLREVQKLHNRLYKQGVLRKHLVLTAGSKTVK